MLSKESSSSGVWNAVRILRKRWSRLFSLGSLVRRALKVLLDMRRTLWGWMFIVLSSLLSGLWCVVKLLLSLTPHPGEGGTESSLEGFLGEDPSSLVVLLM